MTEAKEKYFEQLIATYTDNMRASDVKSNILIFFLAISISTVTAFRAELPPYIPILLLLVPPGCSIFLLILSISPRFVVIPGYPFYVRRSMSPDDFVTPPEDEESLLSLYRHRCAAFGNILYWKVFLFRVAVAICLFYVAVLLVLALGGGLGALSR